MRRLQAVLAAAVMMVTADSVFAQQSSGPDPVDQVGVSAVVRGTVQLSRGTDVVGRQVVSGEPLFLRDDISSGPQGGLQVLLLDETVFTLGPDSELTVDEFVYDPGTDTGKIAASITKGVFRFITGKIAQNRPEDMSIRIPVGTIGIRGTIVGGIIGPEQTEIILLGPGAINNAGETEGRIEVSTPEGSVTISRSGFGTTLIPGEPPTPPRAVAPEHIQAVTAALTEQSPDETDDSISENDNGTAQNGDGGGTGDVSDGGGSDETDAATTDQVEQASGQDSAQSVESSFLTEQLTEAVSEGDSTATEVTQVNGILNGATNTVQELNGQTGQFHFFQTGLSLSDGGTYNIRVDLDFASRILGGGNSGIQVTSSPTHGTGNAQIGENGGISFDTGLNGAAIFQSDTPGTFDCGGSQCKLSGTITLKSFQDIVAGQMDHELTITDSSGENPVNGSGSTTNRSSGLSQ